MANQTTSNSSSSNSINNSNSSTNSANSSGNNGSNTNLIHHNLNNTLLSSTHLLSSMPGLAVAAAAAAGITTTIIPLNVNNNNNNNNINSNDLNATTTSGGTTNQATSSTASSSSSSSTTASNSISQLASLNTNTALIDLITCKLTDPFHVVNDPRMLECGSSACFQCIMSNKDNERNLKCPYCNNLHKIPIDTNKLIANKNLQNFLKLNSRQINQSFNKQLEDSMSALKQKINSQNLSMQSFDQYLTLIQNDVQIKVETMKNNLEKYGEQFIENLKLIQKEVQKRLIEHSSTSQNSLNVSALNTSSTATLNNVVQLQQQLQHQQQQQQQQQQQFQLNHQLGKEKTFQLIGLKAGDPILQLQSNASVMTLLNNTNNASIVNNLNSNHSTYQLNAFHNSSAQTLNIASSNNNNNNNNNHHHNSTSNLNNQQNENKNRNNVNNSSTNTTVNNNNTSENILNVNKSNQIQHNDNLNTSLDVLQNTFNFSNSSSWTANDDDLDDFDSEMNIKPVQTSSHSSSSIGNGQKRHLNKEQAQFNKFVREEVSKKFGDDFLLQHEVNQLDSLTMESIKSEAIATFLPKDTTPVRAWTLAKVSLRSLKRDLRRKQGNFYSNKNTKLNGTSHNSKNWYNT